MLLTAAVLGLGGAASAETPVTASASLDRDWIRIGDPVLLTLVVEMPSGYRVIDPGVPRAIGDLEVLETLQARQERRSDGGIRMVFRYRVTAFSLGDHVLPPIDVAYVGPGDVPGVARSEERPLSVKSVIADFDEPSDIKPLKPQLELPGRLQWLLGRVALLAAALLAFGAPALVGLRVLRRPRARPVLVAEPTTPARRALAELERIAALRLHAEGRYLEHYELLAAALRRYAEEAFGLAVAGRTARELHRELQRAGADPRLAATIHEVARDREVVRFQGFTPYPRHAEESLRAALAAMRRAVAAEEPTVREFDVAGAGSR